MGINFPDAPVLDDIYTDAVTGKAYTFDGEKWWGSGKGAAPPPLPILVGDTKSSFQTTDHQGWILLDGRAVSTLTATQQAAAATLGFTANLPNGDKCGIRMDTAAALGAVGGSAKILQANLPAINTANSGVLTSSGHDAAAVTSSSAGAHQHGVAIEDVAPTRSMYAIAVLGGVEKWSGQTLLGANTKNNSTSGVGNFMLSAGAHTHTVDLPNHTHTVPAHAHSLGGSGTDYYAKAIVANLFVYLGL